MFDVVGGAPLRGTVTLRGGKNAAIPMAIGALVSDTPTTLTAWPGDLGDIVALERLLVSAGASLEHGRGTLTITPPDSHHPPGSRTLDPAGSRTLDPAGSRTLDGATVASGLRSTPLLLTAMLGRHGVGAVPQPGGCTIGERPIDVHLDCLRRLGAHVESFGDSLVARAPKGFRGARLPVAHASTTGTQVAVLGAVLAHGDSEITGANLRPENRAFFQLLIGMGATLELDEVTASIHVRGGLTGRAGTGALSMSVPGSVDEAVTWWVAGLMTGGSIAVTKGASFARGPEVALLVRAGAQLAGEHDELGMAATSLSPFDVEVGAPPAIGSDLHPILAALATCVLGRSTIIDRRFRRHAYAGEAVSMGARLSVAGPTIAIDGPSRLAPGDVTAPDLRGGMALLLLALAAPGRSRIRRVDRVERGYGKRLVETLTSLGADVQRLPDDRALG